MRKIILWMLAVVALLSLTASIGLDVYRGSSLSRSIILAACYFAVLAILVQSRVIRLPRGLYVPLVSTGLHLSDFAKAVAYFLLACIWAYFGARLANDTWLAVGGVLGPPIVFLLIAGVFLFKSIGPKGGR